MSKIIIGLGQPDISKNNLLPAVELSEAIQKIFPMDTDDATLMWEDACMLLNYKYDISVIIDDVIPMLQAIRSDESGNYVVGFGSDTFHARWDLSWTGSTISISAVWKRMRVRLGSKEPSNRLNVIRDEYIAEFTKLLKFIDDAIRESGIDVSNCPELSALKRML